MKYETFDPERRDEARVFIILALLAFGAVSAVHDMMYQRTFWLLIGAALAVPILRADERLSLRSKNVDVPAAADRALPA